MATFTIKQGSVFDVLPTLAAGSVDCCVTSPPYWMLRSYLPNDHELKPLELGSEKTPAEFVANMVRVFEGVKRVLADHGTCWLNIGDSYAGGGNGVGSGKQITNPGSHVKARKPPKGIPAGNLCLIPQRLAIALQDAGWIVRSIVIWHKPAPMPASLSGWQWRLCKVKVKPGWGANGTAPHPGTTNGGSARVPNSGGKKTAGVAEWVDCPGCPKCKSAGGYVLRKGSWRPTSSYEPILMLAKSASYFADGEPVKTPPAAATVGRDKYTRVIDDPDEQFAVAHDHETTCDGANLRDVWTIAAEALNEKHYAAFPTALVEKCLRAGMSAKGYCPKCGMPWVRIVDTTNMLIRRSERGPLTGNPAAANGTMESPAESKTVGWRASCNHHDLEPRPGVVLDPFSGSGRTGICARQLGLDYVGIDLNPEYVEMSKRLIREDMPLFNVDG